MNAIYYILLIISYLKICLSIDFPVLLSFTSSTDDIYPVPFIYESKKIVLTTEGCYEIEGNSDDGYSLGECPDELKSYKSSKFTGAVQSGYKDSTTKIYMIPYTADEKIVVISDNTATEIDLSDKEIVDNNIPVASGLKNDSTTNLATQFLVSYMTSQNDTNKICLILIDVSNVENPTITVENPFTYKSSSTTLLSGECNYIPKVYCFGKISEKSGTLFYVENLNGAVVESTQKNATVKDTNIIRVFQTNDRAFEAGIDPNKATVNMRMNLYVKSLSTKYANINLNCTDIGNFDIIYYDDDSIFVYCLNDDIPTAGVMDIKSQNNESYLISDYFTSSNSYKFFKAFVIEYGNTVGFIYLKERGVLAYLESEVPSSKKLTLQIPTGDVIYKSYTDLQNKELTYPNSLDGIAFMELNEETDKYFIIKNNETDTELSSFEPAHDFDIHTVYSGKKQVEFVIYHYVMDNIYIVSQKSTLTINNTCYNKCNNCSKYGTINDQNCDSCKDSYFLISGTNNCNDLVPPYHYFILNEDNTSATLGNCSSNCFYCVNDTYCLNCDFGYSLLYDYTKKVADHYCISNCGYRWYINSTSDSFVCSNSSDKCPYEYQCFNQSTQQCMEISYQSQNICVLDCPSNCQTCNADKICEACDDGYSLLSAYTLNTSHNDCVEDCNNRWYVDSSIQFYCTNDNSSCPTSLNCYNNVTKQCMDKKYKDENKCTIDCPDNCEDCDNFNTCTSCENGYTLLSYYTLKESDSNCVSTCSNRWYIDLLGNFVCSDSNTTCPENYKCFYELKNQCMSAIYKLIGLCTIPEDEENEEEKEEEKKEEKEEEKKEEKKEDTNVTTESPLKNINSSNILILCENNYVEVNPNYTMIIYDSSAKPSQEQAKNMTEINLGDCENILKDQYNIPSNESLLIAQVDYTSSKGTSDFELTVYSKEGVKLDMSYCKGVSIDVSAPINISQLDISYDELKELSNDGIDVFDNSSEFFNKRCSYFTSKNSTDVPLSKRRSDYFQETPLCKSSCTYESINFDTMKVNCDCTIPDDSSSSVNSSKTDDSVGLSFIDTQALSIFKNELSDNNLDVFLCIKLVFKWDILVKNIGNYVMLAFIGLHIVPFILLLKMRGIIFSNYLKRSEIDNKDNNSEGIKGEENNIETQENNNEDIVNKKETNITNNNNNPPKKKVNSTNNTHKLKSIPSFFSAKSDDDKDDEDLPNKDPNNLAKINNDKIDETQKEYEDNDEADNDDNINNSQKNKSHDLFDSSFSSSDINNIKKTSVNFHRHNLNSSNHRDSSKNNSILSMKNNFHEYPKRHNKSCQGITSNLRSNQLLLLNNNKRIQQMTSHNNLLTYKGTNTDIHHSKNISKISIKQINLTPGENNFKANDPVTEEIYVHQKTESEMVKMMTIETSKKHLKRDEEDQEEEELDIDDMSLPQAIKEEKRSFCQIYLARVKELQPIYKNFFGDIENTEIKYVLITTMIFSAATDFSLNAAFYSDKYIENSYDNGGYDFFGNIPKMFYAFLFGLVLGLVCSTLEAHFPEKQPKNLKEISNISKKVRCKLIAYYSFILFSCILYWYYVTAFCAVYQNSQIGWLIDSLISFCISMLTPFFVALVCAIFRKLALYFRYKILFHFDLALANF